LPPPLFKFQQIPPNRSDRKLFDFEILGKKRDLTYVVGAIVIGSGFGVLVWIALAMPTN
jgi:hypothetical protein